jgi:hypothetical protein
MIAMAEFSSAKVDIPTAKLNWIITICECAVTHRESKLDYCISQTRAS